MSTVSPSRATAAAALGVASARSGPTRHVRGPVSAYDVVAGAAVSSPAARARASGVAARTSAPEGRAPQVGLDRVEPARGGDPGGVRAGAVGPRLHRDHDLEVALDLGLGAAGTHEHAGALGEGAAQP